MKGMDAATGKPIEGEAHLAQSVACILTTPIGTRVGRREFGSLLPDLVDQPANPASRIRIFAATALALRRWEPRIKVTRVGLEQPRPGEGIILVEGTRTDRPRANLRTRITVPLASRSGLTVYA
ncbi:GPW/gp25 family protein [Sphingomonas pokkalii]|uniref:Oxidoreductase n=1 Tax=Sphingomonas pokkalii TaxID=2175090 RepID=A0A2U0SI05_9SPHN|nr:GPW/gp25 family protein [Sphingomonas pokkalii]PVX30964.1 oxidoreductase [Sphingomonas pokkalii]